MRPKATRERLEEKMDTLVAEQAATTESNDQQMKIMIELFTKQHEHRMKQMDRLISVLRGGKRKRSAKQWREATDCDSD